jgi:hypothetical protein
MNFERLRFAIFFLLFNLCEWRYGHSDGVLLEQLRDFV